MGRRSSKDSGFLGQFERKDAGNVSCATFVLAGIIGRRPSQEVLDVLAHGSIGTLDISLLASYELMKDGRFPIIEESTLGQSIVDFFKTSYTKYSQHYIFQGGAVIAKPKDGVPHVVGVKNLYKDVEGEITKAEVVDTRLSTPYFVRKVPIEFLDRVARKEGPTDYRPRALSIYSADMKEAIESRYVGLNYAMSLFDTFEAYVYRRLEWLASEQ